MNRPKKCKICAADPAILGPINTMLTAGVRLKAIVTQFPEFSIFQLSRHRNRSLASESVEAAAEGTAPAASTEIAGWLEKAHRVFALAELNGDSRSASSAISVAVRALTQLSKQVERETEQKEASPDNPDKPLTVTSLDEILRDFAEKRDAENDGVGAKAQCLLTEAPAFAQLVQAIWKNRSILPALLACCVTNYLPQRQTTEEISAIAND